MEKQSNSERLTQSERQKGEIKLRRSDEMYKANTNYTTYIHSIRASGSSVRLRAGTWVQNR